VRSHVPGSNDGVFFFQRVGGANSDVGMLFIGRVGNYNFIN